jgi:hypothetical protein
MCVCVCVCVLHSALWCAEKASGEQEEKVKQCAVCLSVEQTNNKRDHTLSQQQLCRSSEQMTGCACITGAVGERLAMRGL